MTSVALTGHPEDLAPLETRRFGHHKIVDDAEPHGTVTRGGRSMSSAEKDRVTPMRHPIDPLPIDLPVVEDHEFPSPLQSIRVRDLIYIAVGMFGTFAGGALALWVLK